MINKALQFTNDVLDQFFKNRYGLDERVVLLNNLIDANGNVPEINQNKIIISLINIEQETLRAFHTRNQQLPDNSFATVNSSERYNLVILVSANFDDYAESLKFLNDAILFFQINPLLNANAFSSFPVGLEKLEFDIEKITYHEMQSLCTAMGAKYRPSVIYKVRMINIQGNETDGVTPSVLQTSSQIVP